ncbi:MAG: hypothetical protein GTN86_08870, partial [Xanthomonadales bacterium]|nr:hypothetical protein [Xanthomonadales bacterium]NIN59996.1 hypothetical protein [Xanthomonadales bacterium]NIN75364.1 hypothetical protein [Xanthomonadales bacterium]NIO14187.1 hypothetical protein [Xanthomonadales bacterium]NIP12389.1 hypothetical protein [Xanthomonadales bacterium]
DLLVDVKRNRLWVCTAANERFVRFEDVDRGRSALLEFDLSSLELKGRYPIPVDGLPHSLGSMTQTPSGDIFVVDRTLPIVFVKSMIEDRIAPLFMSSNMVSLRDITSSPNGKKLYVADYEMGISVIDLETQDAGFVRVPANLNLG